jgi:hypothetical protein
MKKHKRLLDAYRFEGFVPLSQVRGVFGDPLARIIPLQRRGKKQSVEDAKRYFGIFTTAKAMWFGTSHAEITGFTWKWRSGGFSVMDAAK